MPKSSFPGTKFRAVFILKVFLPLLALSNSTAFPSLTTAGGGKNQTAEVLVYGATPAGIIAAVATSREGKSVILLEASNHLGGMVSGGLGATDTGNRGAIGGYSREFFQRVRDYYQKKYGENSKQVKDCSDGYRFEPHVASAVFRDMLRLAKIKPLLNHYLQSVTRKNGKIMSVAMANGKVFKAKVFIDASYEGDLLAKAGVTNTIGREGKEKYGESLAGVQEYSAAHQWPVKVNGLDESGKPLPFVSAVPMGKPGQGDKKLQAYNFRLCMTKDADLRIPFAKPAHYDPKQFELLARYLAKKPDLKVGKLMNPVPVPNGKTDTNNNGPFSTDFIGGNWDYPEADRKTREKIWKEHADYTKGFLFFLANDPRVPRELQMEMQTWGLSKGEFEETGNWPPQLYVREARRMLGTYIMKEADIRKDRLKEDSVGLGSYNTDSHHVQRILKKDGTVLNEGDFQVGVQPYAIPYRSLVPQKNECSNLLVPVCCSASHVAYGTIRMEPVYMILGQACGVAGAMATEGKAVQDISVTDLQSKLRQQKAVLSPEGLSRAIPSALSISPKTLKGIVVDDDKAEKKGVWIPSTSVGPFVGDKYVHDNNEGQGKSSLRFTPSVPRSGKYHVYLFYSPHANRAKNALVLIHHAKGEKKIHLNQKLKPTSLGKVDLGIYPFNEGRTGWVEIRNQNADGFVVGDAIQLLDVSEKPKKR